MAKKGQDRRAAKRAAMSVKERRANAKEAGVSVKQYKSGQKASSPTPRADRRQANQESYNSQNNTQASDFDFGKATKNKVGQGEIRHLRQQGHSRESIQQAAAASGLKIGGKAQQRFDNWDKRAAAKERAAEVVENPVADQHHGAEQLGESYEHPPVTETSNANVQQEPNTTPVPKPPVMKPPIPNTIKPISIDNEVEQSQDQEVSQDNDINSNVTGDNNNVNISQDNSVRQYGGVNKSFIYNSTNGNNYMDTPVSAATMGGYFHDEDSPAKSASFVDRYQTMNRDYQKQFQNNNFAQQAITKAAQTEAIDVNGLDQRISDRANLSRARSTSMAGDIFGDMFNYRPEDYESVNSEDDDK